MRRALYMTAAYLVALWLATYWITWVVQIK